MTQDRKKALSPAALGLTLLMVSLIGAYAIFLIWPSYKKHTANRSAIHDLKGRMDLMKVLYPVAARTGLLVKLDFHPELPFPKRQRMDRNAIKDLAVTFSDMARTHGMTMIGSDFDINALTPASESISMELSLTGNLFDFRQFLIGLIEFQYFRSVQELSVRTTQGKTKEFRVKMDIGIQKSGS